MKGLRTISEIAHQYGLHPVQVTHWKTEFIARSAQLFESDKKAEQELSMMVELDKLYSAVPTSDTGRMCNELNKLGFAVGRDHTRRLMQRMRLVTVYCSPGTTVGRAIDHVFVERFFETIKHEKLYLTVLTTGHQVNQACREFIAYINCQRDHSSLNNKTPQHVYQSAA